MSVNGVSLQLLQSLGSQSSPASRRQSAGRWPLSATSATDASSPGSAASGSSSSDECASAAVVAISPSSAQQLAAALRPSPSPSSSGRSGTHRSSRPASAKSSRHHSGTLQTWASGEFHGGFTFAICPHGMEHNTHAEVPLCCKMEQQQKQQQQQSQQSQRQKSIPPPLDSVLSNAGGGSGDTASVTDASPMSSSSGSSSSGPTAERPSGRVRMRARFTSPLCRPLTKTGPGGSFPFTPLDCLSASGSGGSSNGTGGVHGLSSSPSACTSTSIASTPDDYLQLGLAVHPLTDPYLMSNLASSWWASLHFSLIRLPCYLLAIVCGALLGIKAVLRGMLLYCLGRPHDSWDMSDEQMASILIRDYQNLLSRLEAPPHSHPTCGCGGRAADCSYFVFDARAIGIYIPFRGLHVAPSISTLIAHRDGRCSIFSISINGEVMFEASAGLDSWKLAKLYVRQAQLYIVLSGVHPLTHFSSEAFQVVTDHFFAPQDLIAQLVAPHAEWNREINSYAMLAEGSVLNAREGTPWLFGIHTCARVYINKLMRACFNERAHAGLSTMHAFPSRERIFSQPLPRVQINVKGKGAPPCWGDEPNKDDKAEADCSPHASSPSTPSAALSSFSYDCPSPTTNDPAASMPSVLPSAGGLDNWLSVNRSFYPYYVSTFEFVSSALNSHQGQVQIADRRDHCREYLRALRHYLRADYSIVHSQRADAQPNSTKAEEQSSTADEPAVSADDSAASAADLSSLTQSLAVVLTEYVFNVSFVHSGQHALLGHVDRQSKRKQKDKRTASDQGRPCIRMDLSPSVSLSLYNQPLLPRSVYTFTDLFRSHVYFQTFVHWWNNKLYANHEILRTRYSFERSGGQLAEAARSFRLSLRRAEKAHLSIAQELKLTPVPLSRICRTIEW